MEKNQLLYLLIINKSLHWKFFVIRYKAITLKPKMLIPNLKEKKELTFII